MLDKEFAATGEPGSHPVGTGAGAAGGAATGAVAGAVVGGPVGAAVGAAVGGGPEPQRDTRSLKRPIRQAAQPVATGWEPLAARRPAQSLAQPWVVPSAQSREPR